MRLFSCPNVEAIVALSSCGAKGNKKNFSGVTPAFLANSLGTNSLIALSFISHISHGDITFAKKMYLASSEGLFNPNWQDAEGNSALLLLSVMSGEESTKFMKELLSAWNIDPNIEDSLGNTPLHLAIMKKNVEKTLTLVSLGASGATPNADGISPASLSQKNGMKEILEETFLSSMKEGNVDRMYSMFPLLYEGLLHVNCADPKGDGILHIFGNKENPQCRNVNREFGGKMACGS